MPLTQKQSPRLRMTLIGQRMLRWTEASVSWSKHFASATHEHASWASPSTRLQLMNGDIQSEDPGKKGPSDPRLVANEDPGAMGAPPGISLLEALPPAIPAPMTPYGMPPMPGTSTVNAATGRRQATSANKVRFLSSARHFLQNSGTRNTRNQDRCHTHTGKMMAARTMDRPS
jgi:hypothetical protein